MHENERESTRMQQNAPECTKMQQDIPECTRMHKDAAGCTRLHQNAPDCTRMQQNALHSIRMQHDAPECTASVLLASPLEELPLYSSQVWVLIVTLMMGMAKFKKRILRKLHRAVAAPEVDA